MDILTCYATLGAKSVVMTTADFSQDPEGLKKFDLAYRTPAVRKRLFRKVDDVIFEDSKVRITYSSAESVSRAKRFTTELLDQISQVNV